MGAFLLLPLSFFCHALSLALFFFFPPTMAPAQGPAQATILPRAQLLLNTHVLRLGLFFWYILPQSAAAPCRSSLSYPAPNHSPSTLKNVLPQAPFAPAKSFPGFICTVSILARTEKRGKAFLRAREKPVPDFPSGSWPYPLFQLVCHEAGLEAVGSERAAERHRGRVRAHGVGEGCSVGWFATCLVVTRELCDGWIRVGFLCL